MKEKGDSKGITLIALVITIIILLILAGVTLAMIAGENGILSRAARVKREYESAAKAEAYELNYPDRYFNGEIYNIPTISDSTPGDLATENVTEDGASITVYKIESIEDLVAFSNSVNSGNKYTGTVVELVNSLDFKSDISYNDPNNTTLFGDYNGDGVIQGIKEELLNGTGFKPIAMNTVFDESTKAISNAFEGEFRGNSNAIVNLYENYTLSSETSTKMVALFGGISGKVGNLLLTGNVIANVGDFTEQEMVSVSTVAYNKGTIENVNSFLKIEINASGNDDIYERILCSGVAGSNYGTVNNCKNGGEITATTVNGSVRIGGVVGSNYGFASNLTNSAPITIADTTVEAHVGGVVAHNLEFEGEMTNLVNTGNIKITGRAYYSLVAGGCMANCYAGTVKNSYNTGSIEVISKVRENPEATEGASYVGGVIANTYSSVKMLNLYNTGNINVETETNCNTLVGGIASQIANIYNSYNSGNIVVNNKSNVSNSEGYNMDIVGGIGGHLYGGTVSNCYSSGSITLNNVGTGNNKPYVGISSLIGYTEKYNNQKGNIKNCYALKEPVLNYTKVNNKDYYGALCGYVNSSVTFTNCYCDNSVTTLVCKATSYTGVSKTDLSGSNLLNYLNSNKGEDGASWKMDGEYPVLDI